MNYLEIKLEIDTIKEYIDTELCKKCEEMRKELDLLNQKLLEATNQNIRLDQTHENSYDT